MPRATLEAHFGRGALAVLRRHDWPGNLRELRNVLEYAAAVCTGPVILPAHLPRDIHEQTESAPESWWGRLLGRKFSLSFPQMAGAAVMAIAPLTVGLRQATRQLVFSVATAVRCRSMMILLPGPQNSL